MRMRKAFTLIELLVVIGIMGLLGTASVGGYQAMQRGMEERGVMQNVNTVVKAAFERAQIDRQPTVVYFWNETLRSETLDENAIVVGKAVAVRTSGRVSLATGDLLVDEFADLHLAYGTDRTGDADGESGDEGGDGSNEAGENTMYLYCLDDLTDVKRSVVYARVSGHSINEVYLNGQPQDNVGSGEIGTWGFKFAQNGKNGVAWKNGSAYGMEFAEITLPHGYIFGESFSTSAENDPIREVKSMAFTVGRALGSGTQNAEVKGSVTVYALRPDGSGGLKSVKVDTVENPQ